MFIFHKNAAAILWILLQKSKNVLQTLVFVYLHKK